MSTTMVIVPPVGPPTVIPIGKAIFPTLPKLNNVALKHNLNNTHEIFHDAIRNLEEPKIYLDERFDVPQDSFYLDINKGMKNERRVFANGTIIIR